MFAKPGRGFWALLTATLPVGRPRAQQHARGELFCHRRLRYVDQYHRMQRLGPAELVAPGRITLLAQDLNVFDRELDLAALRRAAHRR
jgi:hypothetical protein